MSHASHSHTRRHTPLCESLERGASGADAWLSADSWDDQALALSDAGHKVIAYDRRGFGRSDQPGSGYDYDTLSDDLADVMKECGGADSRREGVATGN
jgi:hypothetical protein